MSSLRKVILIGVDGLDKNEILQWLQNGELNTFSGLSTGGDYHDLASTHPPWTPCAWPSLLSGRNPGQHGVFDFFTADGYDKQLIDRSSVDSSYVFEAADAEGRTSIAINYPVTHPAPSLENGAVVPGYLAREDISFSPEHLRDEYEAEYGDYIIYPEYGTDSNAVEEYIKVARHRRDMARFLNARYNWDLLAVQFQVTDSVFHDLDDQEEIKQVLQAVDRFVGDIIDLGGEDPTILIASDHGMGDYEWTFYVNSWLAQEGYCTTTTGEAEYFRQQKDQLKGTSNTEESTSPLETAIETVADAFTQAGLSPQRIHQGLSTVGLAEQVERLLPEEALVAAQNQVVDHPNSAAFQLYFNSLGIHLNVEDRDPEGTIPQSKYEKVRSDLIEKLEAIRDPDGNLVFDAARPREEVYEGKHFEDAPDIALFPRDYQYDVSGSILDTFRRNPHKNHKPNGILLSNRSLSEIDQASIYDISPTVAAELGIPVDSKTDGQILTDTEETVERADWDELAGDYRTTSSKRDTSDVEDRLADLGYME